MRRRKKLKFVNPYKLESELCDVLAQHARANGWKVYPETSGWDLLLEKDIQVGVQAKLKDNVEVLAQTIEWGYERGNFIVPEPDIRAVLVPIASREFHKVAKALRVYVIHGASLKWDYYTGAKEWIREIDSNTALDNYNRKYLTNAKKKCWVPEVEINVPAGVKSPKLVTEWKVKAIKLCFKLREDGYLTSKDFKDAKVSITLWKQKWLVDSGTKDGKLTRYVKNPNATLPDELYPEIAEAFQRDRDKRNKK